MFGEKYSLAMCLHPKAVDPSWEELVMKFGQSLAAGLLSWL